jgi:dihydrodiol dehydrogenase / D-xylose 1-dehydrogenase (NADP)
MEKKTYQWGFVGAGNMAQAMANDLLLIEGSKIAGVTSKTEKSARKFARAFDIPKVFGEVDELVNDPEIDIVYVSTPHTLHYSCAKKAIEAGKAVLLEKPFTLNAKQAKDLSHLAKENKTFLMEAMWIRYLPVIVKLRTLLEEDVIGEIQFLTSAFHIHLDFDPKNRWYNLALGGGSLLDLGIYPISFASMIFKSQPGEIASLAKLGVSGVDEHFGAVFQYPRGAMAMVSAALDGEHDQDTMIFGRKGNIRIHYHPRWKLSRMTVTEYDGGEEDINLPYLGAGYSHQAQEVIECLEKGQLESNHMPLQETVAIMETLDHLRSQWGLKYAEE